MTAFEKYLTDNGYSVSHQIGLKEIDGYNTPSADWNIFNTYKKHGKFIRVGLGQKGHSPYVIFPEIWESKDGKHKLLGKTDLDKLQQQLSHEEFEKLLLKNF